MISNLFSEMLLKNIEALKTELTQFPSEESLWQATGDIKNPAGNIALHLAGNLKHFIGATLGNTGYIRMRDKEFSEKNIPREQLLKNLDEAAAIVAATLSELPDEQLMGEYPLENFGKGRTTHFVLVYLVAHFNYHLGQLNYLRRMIS
jgi:uncharacterized damage-inducible protein DinB